MADLSTFAFKALDMSGVAARGEVDAEDKSSVAAQLRDRQVLLANDDRGITRRCTVFTVPGRAWCTRWLLTTPSGIAFTVTVM